MFLYFHISFFGFIVCKLFINIVYGLLSGIKISLSFKLIVELGSIVKRPFDVDDALKQVSEYS